MLTGAQVDALLKHHLEFTNLFNFTGRNELKKYTFQYHILLCRLHFNSFQFSYRIPLCLYLSFLPFLLVFPLGLILQGRIWVLLVDILGLINEQKMVPQSILTNLGDLWIRTFEWPRVPLYLHVLVRHWTILQERFHPIKIWAQEAVEHHHKLVKRDIRGNTNRRRGHSLQQLTSEYRGKKFIIEKVEHGLLQEKTNRTGRYREFGQEAKIKAQRRKNEKKSEKRKLKRAATRAQRLMDEDE